jgi:5-methylcytosine-specific restriction endonuclease McrA
MELSDCRTKHDFRAYVVARDKHTCQYCGKPKLYGRNLTIDHLIPRCNGGSNHVDNLIVACKQCNTKKNTRSVESYVEKRLAELEREKQTLEKLYGRITNSEASRCCG